MGSGAHSVRSFTERTDEVYIHHRASSTFTSGMVHFTAILTGDICVHLGSPRLRGHREEI
jgi:hypothetical protein